jgi:hypothetical protein
MKKLTLNIEALAVEQFQLEAAAAEPKGTVHANSYVSDAYTDPCRFCPDMPITFTCQ